LSIKNRAVAEKFAEAYVRKEGEPVAVVIGIAKVKALELIKDIFGINLKTVDTFTALETVLSSNPRCH
jgi:hypothetical protein